MGSFKKKPANYMSYPTVMNLSTNLCQHYTIVMTQKERHHVMNYIITLALVKYIGLSLQGKPLELE